MATMAPQLLWIGLGNMGRGMSKNLVEKGNLDGPLLLYNRTKKRSDDLAASLPAGKTEVVENISHGIEKADIIFSCLTDDAAVQAVYAEALKQNNKLKGKIFVECSTIHPDTTEAVAKDVQAAGASFVASPVFGAPAAADAGQLIFVPAGPSSVLDQVRPYMKGVMGKAEIAFDDEPYSKPLQLKLIGNTFVVNMVTVLAEGLTMAEKTGVGAAPLKQFVDTLFGGVYSTYSDRMLQGTYWKREEPLFSAAGSRKDMRHATSVARAAGVEPSLVAVADGYLKDVEEHQGGEKGDIASIYGAARKRAGLKYETDE